MSGFEPRRADWREHATRIFMDAPFVRDVGYRLLDLSPGHVVSELELAPRHRQLDGFVHAGVQATMADHSAGAAGYTLLPADRIILTVEFKISLLRAATGDRLVCRAEVLKAGRSITFAESRVFAVAQGAETLVSVASVSLGISPLRRA